MQIWPLELTEKIETGSSLDPYAREDVFFVLEAECFEHSLLLLHLREPL